MSTSTDATSVEGPETAPLGQIRAAVKRGSRSIAFFCPTKSFRRQFGRLPRLLEETGYTVLYLYGEQHGGDFEAHPTSFRVWGTMVNRLDFIDLFIVPTSMDCLPERSKKVLIPHISFAEVPFTTQVQAQAPDDEYAALVNKHAHFRAFFPLFDCVAVATPMMAALMREHALFYGARQVDASGQELAPAPAPHADAEALLWGLRGHRLPSCQGVVKMGYPSLEEAARTTAECEKIITYAPTPIVGKQGWLDFVSVSNSGRAIMQSLLEAFPDYLVVFKPYADELKDVVNDIVAACQGYPNFVHDTSGGDYQKLYARTAVLVSDFSSTAYTFALANLKPVVFYSPNEAQLPPEVSGSDYCQHRTKVGAVVSDTGSLVRETRRLLGQRAEYEQQIRELRARAVFNFGTSEEYLVRQLEYVIAGQRRPDWDCYERPALPSRGVSLVSSQPQAAKPVDPAIPTSDLFAAGDYSLVAARRAKDQWQTYAALGLIGRTQEAIEGLKRFDLPEARFYEAVAHWMEGNEARAQQLLAGLDTPHARNLLALIAKPQINVLAQSAWPRHQFRDPKFQVWHIGIPRVVHDEKLGDQLNNCPPTAPFDDVFAACGSCPTPDFYFAQMLEWHFLPYNLDALPCPIFGVTSDFDLHIHNVEPWLPVFDEVITAGAEERDKVHRLTRKPAAVFPKLFALPDDLPSANTGRRESDLYISGTLTHPYHPDKAELLHEVLGGETARVRYVDGFLSPQEYHQEMANTKVSFTYVRHPNSMPSRGLEALAMGCAVVAQQGSALTLYAGEAQGVVTYDPRREPLAAAIQRVLDKWDAYAPRAQRGAASIRKQFAFGKCLSQFLRFLTFLAAKPRSPRLPPRRPEQLAQKRGVMVRGHVFSTAINLFQLQNNVNRWGRAPTHRNYLDAARELNLFLARDLPDLQRQVQSEERREMLRQEARQVAAKAKEIFTEAAKWRPRSLALRFNALRFAFHHGTPDEAAQALASAREFLALDPSQWELDLMDDVMPWDYYGSFFNYRRYLDTVTAALGHRDSQTAPLVNLILASLHYYVGHYSGDVEHFEKAVALDPEFPFYRYHCARGLLQRRGEDDLPRAVRLLVDLAQHSMLLGPAFRELASVQARGGITIAELPAIERSVRRLKNFSESGYCSSKEHEELPLVLPPGLACLPTLEWHLAQPSTLAPQPSTLAPQPSTLNSQPLLPSHLAACPSARPRRVLLIGFECCNWQNARAWSYNGFFAFEEGLQANGAETFVLPALAGLPSNDRASWLNYAATLCAGREFDQAWIWITHNDYSPEFFQWFEGMAPLRVGVVMESMEHTLEEEAVFDKLRGRRRLVVSHLRHCTHVLTFDDADAATFPQELPIKALWCPPMAPWRTVCESVDLPPPGPAVFYGSLYSAERQAFLKLPQLRRRLSQPALPETRTDLPRQFDAHQLAYLKRVCLGGTATLPQLQNYLGGLRRLRRRFYDLWLEGLRAGYASVNLPSIFKSYAGRVVESMAAGRPVISWTLSARPRSSALFVPGKEILLFGRNDPAALAGQIDRLQNEPAFARQLAENARQKVLGHHTAEIRVRQVLDWLEHGVEPDYGEEGAAVSDDAPAKAQATTDCAAVLDAVLRDKAADAGPGAALGMFNVAEPSSRDTAAAAQPSAGFRLPPAGLVGCLKDARARLDKHDCLGAWKEATAALQRRPFHPEAWLMLAEIAREAGDLATARASAKRARDLAPGWKRARQFHQSLPAKGGGRMLKLPELPPVADRPRLTVCLIAKNEERFIAQYLRSVQGLAGQIVVLDTGSTDRTAQIAREHGAEVHSFPWNDDFSAARNAALEHAAGDWILVLDADEELAPGARETLLAEISRPGVMAYRLPMTDVGREAEGQSFVPRLFRNAPGLFYVGRVHEQVFSSILVRAEEWGLGVELGKTPLLHYGYTQDMVRSRDKIARNLRLLVQAVSELPNEPNLLMNLGLELVRAGQLEAGLKQYREAFVVMSHQPARQVPPELRESLLTQYSTQLVVAKDYPSVVQVLQSPLARSGGLTASMCFTLGLALLELNRVQEAAEQFRQCLTTRDRPALSPINKEIRTGAPHHCLAMCLARLGQNEAAGREFQAAAKESPDSLPILLDCARFAAEQGQPVEALNLLHQLVSRQAGDVRPWQLGGQVALSRPEFLDVAADWTGLAHQHFPQDPVITRQRAEALMLGQDVQGALALWQRVNGEEQLSGAAAEVLCQLAMGKPLRPLPAGVEAQVSQKFLHWYRRLLHCGAEGVIQRANARLDDLTPILPTAARGIKLALAQADQA